MRGRRASPKADATRANEKEPRLAARPHRGAAGRADRHGDDRQVPPTGAPHPACRRLRGRHRQSVAGEFVRRGRRSARQNRSARRARVGADEPGPRAQRDRPCARSARGVAGIGAGALGGQSRPNRAVQSTRRQPDRLSQSRTRPAAENTGRAHRTPRRRDPTPHRRRSRAQAPLRHPAHHPRRRARGGPRARHRSSRRATPSSRERGSPTASPGARP